MSELGLGTAALGRPQYINVRHEDSVFNDMKAFKHNSFQVLDAAYNLGIRYFDTAPGYGLAEQLLIDWLQAKNDSSINVATKWGYTYTANFDPNTSIHEVKEHSLSKLNEQWQISKQLLPYLKVYQIHSATFDTGVLENEVILHKLYELKEKYNIKIGITTTGHNQVEVIKKALDISVEEVSLFEAFQFTFNILDQSVLEIVGDLQSQGKMCIVKEALANGRLFPNGAFPEYQKLYKHLHKLSEKYKVGVDAIALNFCNNKFDKSIVLSGASSQAQLQQNIQQNLFTLTEEDIRTLQQFAVEAKTYWSERKQLSWN